MVKAPLGIINKEETPVGTLSSRMFVDFSNQGCVPCLAALLRVPPPAGALPRRVPAAGQTLPPGGQGRGRGAQGDHHCVKMYLTSSAEIKC